MASFVIIILIIVVVCITLKSQSDVKSSIDMESIKLKKTYDKFISLNFMFGPTDEVSYIGFKNMDKLIDIRNVQMGGINEVFSVKYTDITGVELLENGSSVMSIGSIIGGSMLAGETGAIIGGMNKNNVCNSIKIKIVIDDFETPYRVFTIYSGSIKTDSIKYQKLKENAVQIIETIKYVISKKDTLFSN